VYRFAVLVLHCSNYSEGAFPHFVVAIDADYVDAHSELPTDSMSALKIELDKANSHFFLVQATVMLIYKVSRQASK
jgi:hypothetical protein